MKQIIGSTGDSLSPKFDDILLNLFPGNNSLVSEFSKEFEAIQFHLGDEITNYTKNVELSRRQDNGKGFYIICEGRVRLVGFNISLQREVSVSLLEAGDCFGADELFDNNPLAYRAVGAATVIIAFISSAKLETWLDKIPNLQGYLCKIVKEQKALIFFKTLTKLRAVSSYHLKQIIPYLVETRFQAGEVLHRATQKETGCFWLQMGEIESQNPLSKPPQVGANWGYPDDIPVNWVAKTDLLVYKLPQEHWEAVQLVAPLLTETENAKKQVVKAKIPNLQESKSSLLIPTPTSESKVIPFPQPTKGRKRGLSWHHPFVQQQSAMDCGVACLAMVSQYWGKHFSINMLRNLARVTRSGASLKNLAVAAENIGFQARPVRASLNRLIEQMNPWIAHWQGE